MWISSHHPPCWDCPRASTGQDTCLPMPWGHEIPVETTEGTISTWLLRGLTKWFLLWRESASLGHPMLSHNQERKQRTQKTSNQPTKKPNKTKTRHHHTKIPTTPQTKQMLQNKTHNNGFHEIWAWRRTTAAVLAQSTESRDKTPVTHILHRSSALLKQTSARESVDLHNHTQRKAIAQFLMKVIGKLLLNWLSVFPLCRSRSMCMSITEDAIPLPTVFMTSNTN